MTRVRAIRVAVRCDGMGCVRDDALFCTVLISRNIIRGDGYSSGASLRASRGFGTAFICVEPNLRHAFPRSACLSRGLPVPSPVSTYASRRTRSTPSSTRCASLRLGAPGRDGEVGDVSFGERAKTSSKTSSITPVAPGTRRSRSGRRGSSNPRRTRTRTAVCRHASTRTPRRHPRGSCSARPDASEKVRRRDGEGKIFSAVSPLARVSFARVGFVERYVSGYNTLRTRHLVICSSISSSVFPLVSTTVR